ncbi:MAG: PspA/IM30 family protein [Verrucomicrobiota bacterium]
MSIFERLRRIATANFNAILDKAESPEIMLTDSIRSMEDALKEARQAAADYALTIKKHEKEEEQLKRLRAEWQHKAEEAVRVGEEKLARTALEEKVKADDRIKALGPAIRERGERYKELKENLVKLQDKLKEAQLKLSDLQSRKQAASAQKTFDQHLGKAAGAGTGGSEFEKFESQVMQTEAEAELGRELREVAVDDTQVIEEKSAELRVNAELEALKKNLKKK